MSKMKSALSALVLVALMGANANAQYAGRSGRANPINNNQLGFQQYQRQDMKWTLPPNNLHLEDTGQAANITKEQFEAIIDGVMKVWMPIAQTKGVELSVNKRWDDQTVNASAQQSGKKWVVNMYGGLARRPEVTPDGFALVVCHELGHHFGGYAFYDGGNAWAANEGQSDYFATQACARMIWGKDAQGNARVHNRIGRTELPPIVHARCDQAWKGNAKAIAWCERTSAAGHSLANLLAALGKKPTPQFDSPDKSVVTKTNNAHPQAQCRLDTYFAGALCAKTFDLNVIPGRNNPKGQASPEAEADAMKVSCSAKQSDLGARPSCWFKSVASF